MSTHQVEVADDTPDKTLGPRDVSPESWQSSWKKGRIGFHSQEPHKFLVEHADELVDGKQNQRIFFPMCGKAVGMKWLLDRGHSVVGVDCAETAMHAFSEEQHIQLHQHDIPGAIDGKVYKSEDGRLQLYCCDILKIDSSELGKFDGVWDRGALVAINISERHRYVDAILSLLAPGGRLLLVTIAMQPGIIGGPPHRVDSEMVRSLYGDRCVIEQLDEQDSIDVRDNWKEAGFTEWPELLFRITCK